MPVPTVKPLEITPDLLSQVKLRKPGPPIPKQQDPLIKSLSQRISARRTAIATEDEDDSSDSWESDEFHDCQDSFSEKIVTTTVRTIYTQTAKPAKIPPKTAPKPAKTVKVSCPICMETIPQFPMQLGCCAAKFHPGCAMQWLTRNPQSGCPSCRTPCPLSASARPSVNDRELAEYRQIEEDYQILQRDFRAHRAAAARQCLDLSTANSKLVNTITELRKIIPSQGQPKPKLIIKPTASYDPGYTELPNGKIQCHCGAVMLQASHRQHIPTGVHQRWLAKQ